MSGIQSASRSVGALLVVLWAASVASAQQPAPPEPSPGPLVLEPLETTFLLAPEVKFTDFAGEVGVLAGGYGAWIKDEHLLAGAGLYSLATDRDTRGLTYGGLILGWVFDPIRPIRVCRSRKCERAARILRRCWSGSSGSATTRTSLGSSENSESCRRR